jgi:hypothetical protein
MFFLSFFRLLLFFFLLLLIRLEPRVVRIDHLLDGSKLAEFRCFRLIWKDKVGT